DVMNKQRTVIYDLRKEVLAGEDLRDMVMEMTGEVAEDLAHRFSDAREYPEQWDLPALRDAVVAQFGYRLDLPQEEVPKLQQDSLAVRVREGAEAAYARKEEEYGADAMRYLERMFLLSTI
ncbi:MAG: preprotein translocase subunit SecA, partial [Deltaproteobacteria bacterium]